MFGTFDVSLYRQTFPKRHHLPFTYGAIVFAKQEPPALSQRPAETWANEQKQQQQQNFQGKDV